jgi:hypothetical protein
MGPARATTLSLVPVLTLALAACGSDASPSPGRMPQATPAQLEAAGLDRLSLAPASARVDLKVPEFSHPTRVTNRLFPISDLHSAVLNGRVDGKAFRTETTLLPYKRILQWPPGKRTETLVSQYVAFLDGRIEEVALDFYAQADDRSVWYFGEDVFNYEDGRIADRAGTWLAGKDGPAAMIMPARPKVGDVYRPENVPGLVFEEVRVKATGRTVDGPRGRVAGAIVAGELHQDGSREDKIFAPGYGEFFTGSEGDEEAMALAVPTDKLPSPPPAALRALSDAARESIGPAGSRDWDAVAPKVETMTRAWSLVRAGGVPPRLEAVTTRALQQLARAVDARDAAAARQAAIAVIQAGLDLELRHRPVADVNRDRLELWARRLQVDATAGDDVGVRGDLAAMEWIRDRIAHTLDEVERTELDTRLGALRVSVTDDDLREAAAAARRLRRTLAALDG